MNRSPLRLAGSDGKERKAPRLRRETTVDPQYWSVYEAAPEGWKVVADAYTFMVGGSSQDLPLAPEIAFPNPHAVEILMPGSVRVPSAAGAAAAADGCFRSENQRISSASSARRRLAVISSRSRISPSAPGVREPTDPGRRLLSQFRFPPRRRPIRLHAWGTRSDSSRRMAATMFYNRA
jgi:hypothetical protein